MMTTVLLVALAAAIGVACTMVSAANRRAKGLEEEKKRLEEEKAAALEAQREEYERRLERERGDYERRLREEKEDGERRLEKQREDLRAERETMSAAFKDVASKVLEEQRVKIKEAGSESLERLVKPVKEQIEGLRGSINRAGESSAARSASFEEHMKRLMEAATNVGTQAEGLTRALRGNVKAQGNWGEVILGNLLEKSGLREGEEYELQGSYRDEEGKRQIPDVVVKFPDGKRVVIDSKVSLNAFMDYNNAESEEEAEAAKKRHLESVESHVRELGGKDYAKVVGGAFEYVLMFVQNDAAYVLALSQDATLAERAYEKRVVLTSPTTLMLTLGIVHNMWQAERQRENVGEMVEEISRLWDKLAGFLEKYQELGKLLTRAQTKYDDARGSLMAGKGNLVGRFRRFRELGLNPKKQLPETEEGGTKERELTDGEAEETKDGEKG